MDFMAVQPIDLCHRIFDFAQAVRPFAWHRQVVVGMLVDENARAGAGGGAVASVGTGNSIKLNAGRSPPPPIDLLGRCHVYCKRDCSKCLKSILNVNGQLTHLHLGQFPLAQPMHCLGPKWSFHCSLQSAAFSRLLEWHVPRCFSFLP